MEFVYKKEILGLKLVFQVFYFIQIDNQEWSIELLNCWILCEKKLYLWQIIGWVLHSIVFVFLIKPFSDSKLYGC